MTFENVEKASESAKIGFLKIQTPFEFFGTPFEKFLTPFANSQTPFEMPETPLKLSEIKTKFLKPLIFNLITNL